MGIRRSKNDSQLKALRDLLQQQTDPQARVEVERLIGERLGRPIQSGGDAAGQLISHFLDELGGREVSSRQDVGTKPIVYCVTNGRNILQIGQGLSKRLKGLFPGSPCPKHTKAFIVAASNVLHGGHHRFFCVEAEDAPERRRIEGQLQIRFGETFIEGYGRMTSLAEASMYLWEQLGRVRAAALEPDLAAALELALHDGDALYILYRIPRYRARLEELFDGYFKV